MALGRPVMLVWPREEDFTHDQYRPMAVVKASAGLDANGLITAWTYRNVEAQIAGGVVHGLNAALYGQQTFVNGVAQRRNFSSNRMIRLQEMPAVAVTLIPRPLQADRSIPIGGIGELGVPTFAPALANAVFKLSGTRVRSLPFFPNAVMGGL